MSIKGSITRGQPTVKSRRSRGVRARWQPTLLPALPPIDEAACTNAPVEWFWTRDRELITHAVALCHKCPVTVECAARRIELEQARDIGIEGVWGGVRWVGSEGRPRRARIDLKYKDLWT